MAQDREKNVILPRLGAELVPTNQQLAAQTIEQASQARSFSKKLEQKLNRQSPNLHREKQITIFSFGNSATIFFINKHNSTTLHVDISYSDFVHKPIESLLKQILAKAKLAFPQFFNSEVLRSQLKIILQESIDEDEDGRWYLKNNALFSGLLHSYATDMLFILNDLFDIIRVLNDVKKETEGANDLTRIDVGVVSHSFIALQSIFSMTLAKLKYDYELSNIADDFLTILLKHITHLEYIENIIYEQKKRFNIQTELSTLTFNREFNATISRSMLPFHPAISNKETQDLTLLIEELLRNAIKYSKSELLNLPKNVDLFCETSSQDNSEIVILTISNTGVQVIPKESEILFEPQQRAEKNKDSIQGLGLGLGLMREKVEEFGGTLMFVTPKQPYVTAIQVILPAEYFNRSNLKHA
jgi:signal transduction histidine kinase